MIGLQPGLKSSKAWPYHGSVTGFSPRRPVFEHKLVHVGFVVNRVTLKKAFVQVLQFSPITINPPMAHIHSRNTDTT